MTPEIFKFNSEFKVGTLNPKPFKFGEICRENDFLSNPDIFPPAICRVCGRTKMADIVMESQSQQLMAIDGF